MDGHSGAVQLLDRLALLRSCIGQGGGYVSREGWVEDTAKGRARYHLAGQPAEVPADYPTWEQVRSEPQQIGQQLAVVARQHGLDHGPFDELAVDGWHYLTAGKLVVTCQSLRTALLTGSPQTELHHLPGSGGGDDHSLPDGLDRNAVAVLFCLSNRAPALLTLDDVVVAAKLSRDTASKSVAELVESGLAHRPKGNRKGATVTDKGQSVAAQIRR